MARPTTKAELVAAADREFERLLDRLDGLPAALRDDATVTTGIDDRSQNPRDVLAHLHAWHRMMLDWYEVGMAGGTPAMPADGYTWRETPALNEAIWVRSRDTSYDDALAQVRDSHALVRALVDDHTDDELFTKRHYAWTGSTSLGAYLVSALSSHYVWAQTTLRRQAEAFDG